MNREIKLRYLVAGFCLGFVLCAFLYPLGVPADKGTDLDVKSLQIDVAHLQEQQKELDRRMQACLDWILAHDREAINDDLKGGQRVLTTEHENLQWEFRTCLASIGALFMWMLYRQLGQKK